MTRPARRKGFSFAEVLAVVGIIGVIAVIVIPRVATNAVTTKKNACYVNKANLEVQINLWYRNQGSWPATNLSDIGASTTYFPEGLPTCPVDGSSYTLDTTTHQISGHTH